MARYSLIFVPRSARELRSPTALLPDWNIISANQRATMESNNPDKEPCLRYVFVIETMDRPRVAYVTFFDAVFLNSYLLIFLTTASVVAAPFAMCRSRSSDIAERWSAIGRLAYPVLLVMSNLILVASFWR